MPILHDTGNVVYEVRLGNNDFYIIGPMKSMDEVVDAARQLWVEAHMSFVDPKDAVYGEALARYQKNATQLDVEYIKRRFMDGYVILTEKAVQPPKAAKKKPGRKKKAAPAPKKRTMSTAARKKIGEAQRRIHAERVALRQQEEQEAARAAYLPLANNTKTLRDLNRHTPPSTETPIEEGEGA